MTDQIRQHGRLLIWFQRDRLPRIFEEFRIGKRIQIKLEIFFDTEQPNIGRHLPKLHRGRPGIIHAIDCNLVHLKHHRMAADSNLRVVSG